MTKPGCDLRDRRGRPKPSYGVKEFVLRVQSKRAASLQVRPQQLDRVQLGAVCREVEREAAKIENRLADNVHLVDAEVVEDDDVAWIDQLRESLRNVGPSTAPRLVMIFGFSPRRIAPMSETVFQQRNGLVPMARSPRSERAYSRHMPVFTNDSSRKTRLLRSAFRRNAQNSARRARFSGESRSLAMKDFFFERTRAGQALAVRLTDSSPLRNDP
jgi:hypothetical protein